MELDLESHTRKGRVLTGDRKALLIINLAVMECVVVASAQ